jgi:histidinol-phosphate phosphatase family protein
MKKAVFLERDGILNTVKAGPRHPIGPLTFDEFELNQSAVEPVRKLKAAGFVIAVIANQPGLSRGYQSRRELDRMHDRVRQTFQIDDIFMCPHTESDHCPCLLPRPGLLIEAAFKWQLNLDHSLVVSNRWQAAEASRTAGCTSLLLKSPWVGNVHDYVLDTMDKIAEKAISLRGPLECV